MQSKYILPICLFLSISSLFIVSQGCKKKEAKPVIGETFKGGLVFFIDNTGEHGLVAAASDQTTSAEWGCMGAVITGGKGTAVGTGMQNTIDITSSCSEAAIAARVCNDLVLDGFSDWYLPSKDELNLMFEHKAEIGGFADDLYWSSSEKTVVTAWLQSFGTGTQYSTTQKDYGTRVRAIRSF
jgi:hypothetical protein